MDKVIYVPEGQEIHLENLYCENLIVKGVLIVEGEIVAKHIKSTNGFIRANTIRAKSLVGFVVEAHSIIVDRLIAVQVIATVVCAVQRMAVSSYVSAGLVKAGKITLADSDIADLQSDNVTYLPVKNRSLWGTLFASFMRSTWLWLNGDGFELSEEDFETEENTEFRSSDTTASELQRKLINAETEHQAKLSEMDNNRIFMPSETIRGSLLKQMIDRGEKSFENINGFNIYLGDRHSTIYEMVNRIYIKQAQFTNCVFDKACFDNVTFHDVEFHGVSFKAATLEDVSFCKCLFDNCDFTDAGGINTAFSDCNGDLSFLQNLEFITTETCKDEMATVA